MVKNMSDVNKVIKIANDEVGYLEKKTNSQLYSKTANVGSANYTKYWKDLAPGMNGLSWCNAFVNWCFVKAFGEKEAKKMLYSNSGFSYYTPTSSQYFKNNKRWFSKPKVGDIIYFKNTERICHVGLVYKVNAKYVYTIEGNTSGGSSVVSNGGGVFKKSYLLSNSRIAGYGRPKYGTETKNSTKQKTEYTKKQFIKDIQSAIGVTCDGIVGKETLSNLVELSTTKNNKHKAVTPVQKYLNKMNYDCGNVDGIFGEKTKQAVISYQKAKKIKENGIVNLETWQKLFNV